MYIALDLFGKYKIFKNEKEMLRVKNKYEYCIFDISSTLKGPLHTMVPSSTIYNLPDTLRVEIVVEACPRDLPFKEENVFSSNIEINTLTELYSIGAQCYQYEGFNNFIQDRLIDGDIETCSDINVEEIRIIYQEASKVDIKEFHYFYNIPCSFLRKFLNANHICLCANELFKNKFLILNNGRYHFSKDIPDEYDYIGIPIIGSESFYLLTRKQYKRFMKIRDLEITVSIYDCKENGDSEFNPIEFFNTIEPCSHSFFEMLLFIPQYIAFQHLISAQIDYFDLAVQVLVNYDDIIFNIVALPKDTAKGVSLFKIIDRITKI